MVNLLRAIEQRLPGADKRAAKRAQKAGWSPDHRRIAQEAGISLDGVRLTPEVRASADETMRSLGLSGDRQTYQPPFVDFDGADAGLNTSAARRARGI